MSESLVFPVCELLQSLPSIYIIFDFTKNYNGDIKIITLQIGQSTDEIKFFAPTLGFYHLSIYDLNTAQFKISGNLLLYFMYVVLTNKKLVIFPHNLFMQMLTFKL